MEDSFILLSLTWFASVALCILALFWAFPRGKDTVSKKTSILRCFLSCIVLGGIAAAALQLNRNYAISILSAYGLSTVAFLFGVLSSYWELVKAWLVKQKPLIILIAVIVLFILVIKLADSEYARGYANGQKAATEEYQYRIEEAESASETSYDRGYGTGYDDGYFEGYDDAWEDAEAAYADYAEWYETGYSIGYDEGYGDAIS